MGVYIIILSVLAFLGIIDSSYLAWKHLKGEKLKCPIGEDSCNIVAQSKYSNIFGVRNEFMGILFYFFIFTMAIMSNNNESELIKQLIFIASSMGLLFSASFVYIQARIIRKYCFYCLISALLNLLIFIIVLIL